MKFGRFVMKVAAVLALVGAAVYAATLYWDTLVDVFYLAVGKAKEAKAKYLDGCACKCAGDFPEFDDFDD